MDIFGFAVIKKRNYSVSDGSGVGGWGILAGKMKKKTSKM